MTAGPQTLDELDRAIRTRAKGVVDLMQPEINGGRLTAAGLGALDATAGLTTLRVSGLDQPAFEALVSRHGRHLRALDLWKCPRIEDLTPLESLPDLRVLSIFWNQRTGRLWDLARTPRLTSLRFRSLNRLHRIDDLAASRSLRELEFGDGFHTKATFESLEPLSDIASLRALDLSARRIDDGRIQPLAACGAIERLEIQTNLFTTEQFAWLRSRLDPSVRMPGAIRGMSHPLQDGDKLLDVLLVGKRKPLLSSISDSRRIARHVQAYDEMVARFTADPSAEPS